MNVSGANVLRALAVGIFLCIATNSSAFACDDFAKAPSSRWYVYKHHGVAWLLTPCGDRFLSLGVDVVDGGASGEHLGREHYDWHGLAPSLQDWTTTMRQQLGDWGFNTAGAWSLPPQ